MPGESKWNVADYSTYTPPVKENKYQNLTGGDYSTSISGEFQSK